MRDAGADNGVYKVLRRRGLSTRAKRLSLIGWLQGTITKCIAEKYLILTCVFVTGRSEATPKPGPLCLSQR